MQPGARFSDLLISHWPNAEFLRRSLFDYGQLPLWNPQIINGAPFAADPLAGLWYLPNWLAVILPLPFAFNLLFALHLAWGGWGMFCWARADGFGLWPALVGGLGYAAMPKVLAHIAAGHVSLVFAVSWMPWLMWSVERGLLTSESNRSLTRCVSLTALMWALIFLADVRWGVYAGGVLIVWWLARGWRRNGNRSRARLFSGLAVCLVLFLLLTAVLWLPLLEFVQHSSRSELTLEDAALFSLPPQYLIGLLAPSLGGFQEYMMYFGVVLLVLAVIGAVKGAGRDRVGTLTVIGLGVVSVWWALGPGAGLFAVFSRLPFVSLLRVPSRAMFISGLASCWLAVRGAAAVENGFRLRGRAWNLTSVGILVGLWILAIGGSIATQKVLANFLITAVAATGVLIGLRLRPATIVLTALVAVELLAVDSTLITPQPVTRSTVAEWLSQQPGVWRVYSPSYSLPQLDAAQLGIEQADGVNPLQLAETVNYMEAATGVERHGYSVTVPAFEMQNDSEPIDVSMANAGAFPDPQLLGALNVRYVASEFDIEAEGLELRTAIGQTRLYENVYDAGRVRGGALVSWSPNRIVVEANGLGRVTLAEVWYPGWAATVDSVPAEIEQDGLFRSVRVEEGGREIVFEFKPLSFFVGAGSSFLGIILTFILFRLRDDSNQTL